MKNKIVLVIFIALCCPGTIHAQSTGAEDRAYWIQSLTKIADPVLTNLSQGTLKRNMPFESLSDEPLRKQVSYLEAVGRTLCGVAPWLEIGPDDTEEGKQRAQYIALVAEGLKHAVDPDSPDYLVFDNRHPQALVDAALLAQGLLRAPKQVWGNLDAKTQARMLIELKKTRSISPKESNWLLFASIIEAALLEFSGEYDAHRLYHGVDRFCKEWYKGDAWYGDGQELHFDYYNSFIIHPMLTDVLHIINKHGLRGGEFLDRQLTRQKRIAVQLERLISPEGTYPVVGRSIVYRFGAFHALAQASLLNILPKELPSEQVRCALTAVIWRVLKNPLNFDENGWLTIGLSSSQIHMSETYINTGSVYLCATVFLPLGLSAEHPFWTGSYTEWTNLKAWKGVDVGTDKALRKG